MWDGWEQAHGGGRSDGALLRGYRRSFNKKSVRNWGTSTAPGPTLGLEQDEAGTCIGTAFEFTDDRREALLRELQRREGRSFTLPMLAVLLADGRTVNALVPMNDRAHSTYIGDVPIAERVAMARIARGSSGACADYVRNIHRELLSRGIHDAEVNEFSQML